MEEIYLKKGQVKLLYSAVYNELQRTDKTTRNYISYQHILEQLKKSIELDMDCKIEPCILSINAEEIIF